MDHQFLAEGIDKALRTSRDDELVGVQLGEHDRVADDVAVKPSEGGDDERIVDPFLYIG